ncbi:probable conidiation protein con-6 [Ramularia collo-cygni]|uniref:Probable conidiation protein con-6 n=1 Tax=Ramularia collo-cygni TaxID=112498 RepID=A0A2D3UT51_9PEZI|nr:probable conidiation protein con-6 [Ramularia collo-cygni]CZT14957.1 probable conidiation protein con-6 [Ramularia collo-cygni]
MDSQGSKSVMSDDMKDLTHGKEDISNSASGHEANLSNPNTSEASKQHSREVLERMGGDAAFYGKSGETTSKSAADNLEGSRAAN